MLIARNKDMSETKNTQENETKNDVPEEEKQALQALQAALAEARQALSELARRELSKTGTFAISSEEQLRDELLASLITLYKDVLDKRIHATPDNKRFLREALIYLIAGQKEGSYEAFKPIFVEWKAMHEIFREHPEIQLLRSLVSKEEPIKIQLRT